jgi:sodium-dependent dicarboxylate transporter 2/3/5
MAVLTWVSEPLHGLSAPLVALCVTLALFGSGLLGRRELNALDWSTLGLIAGGISLGKLLETTGATTAFQVIDWSALPRMAWLSLLVAASAGLSSLMSNTGTAALLIPLASTVDGSASTAVIIAIAASFGMPFSISTPPNAMAYGEGGLRSSDLLFVGLTLMLFGCALTTLTGSAVLQLLGVP